ncbi:MAG: heavy metal-associated domain-containing protein [Candidatus Marinimicrobia bacterium]|nr:heavy metal-associated domain-containing protein [Candidatus Neomarinimicrobiota bacterium]MDP6966463.1 heavy metal-associated domain-containing protein [Candidatus Neomarinimicrobiota bacterium]|tara:strand:- start:1761 stop:2132 length:372 start_codon:yes stop_codon:yes gene_type:complete
MKLIKLLTIGLSLLLVISCSKTDAEDQAAVIKGSKSAMVDLPTMQCGMCERAIETGLSKVNGVVSIDVDVDEKNAAVIYEAGLINLAGIEKAIAKLGYQANETSADSETYADLAKCCKLPEDR